MALSGCAYKHSRPIFSHWLLTSLDRVQILPQFNVIKKPVVRLNSSVPHGNEADADAIQHGARICRPVVGFIAKQAHRWQDAGQFMMGVKSCRAAGTN